MMKAAIAKIVRNPPPFDRLRDPPVYGSRSKKLSTFQKLPTLKPCPEIAKSPFLKIFPKFIVLCIA